MCQWSTLPHTASVGSAGSNAPRTLILFVVIINFITDRGSAHFRRLYIYTAPIHVIYYTYLVFTIRTLYVRTLKFIIPCIYCTSIYMLYSLGSGLFYSSVSIGLIFFILANMENSFG